MGPIFATRRSDGDDDENVLPELLAYLIVGFSASVCVAAPELTIQVQDYVPMPITDGAAGKGMNALYLSRVNFLYEEPGRNRHQTLRQ